MNGYYTCVYDERIGPLTMENRVRFLVPMRRNRHKTIEAAVLYAGGMYMDDKLIVVEVVE